MTAKYILILKETSIFSDKSSKNVQHVIKNIDPNLKNWPNVAVEINGKQ